MKLILTESQVNNLKANLLKEADEKNNALEKLNSDTKKELLSKLGSTKPKDLIAFIFGDTDENNNIKKTGIICKENSKTIELWIRYCI